MAKNQTIRLKPSLLQTDRDGFSALLGITAYTPANPVYATAAITTARDGLNTAQTAESQAIAAVAAARDNAVKKEWEFHNLMLGAKDQILAQFGRDSNEAQGIGLKKKSEYKSRGSSTKGSASSKAVPTP